MSRIGSRDERLAFSWPASNHKASTKTALYTGIAAVTAGILAPELIPHKVFQVAAVAVVAVIVWDWEFIARFYRCMFSRGPGQLDRKKHQPPLIKYPSLLFCGMIMVLLANIILSPIPTPFLRYDTVPVLLGCIALLGVLPSLHLAAIELGTWIDSRPKSTGVLFITCIFSALFLTQISIAVSIYSSPIWDPSFILSSAFGLANGSAEVLDANYFAKYPNNITLTLLLAAFNRMMFFLGVSNFLLASILLNLLILLTGILLTYLSACRLAGTGAAILTLLPSSLFVVLSPWITVPYSDTFGLFFPALLIYLYVRSRETARGWQRVSLWAAMGLTGAVGYSIKPTVVIALAAMVAVTLAPLVGSRRASGRIWPAIGLSFVLVGAFAGGAAALVHTENSSSAIPFDLKKNTEAVPLTHFLKMGAHGHGGYNEQDVAETLAIADPGDRFRSSLNSYQQRVTAMGPAGYADFLRRKAVWTFGDGSFYVWSEGPIATHEDPFPSKGPVSRKIQSYLWVKGEHFPFVTGIWQSFWLVTLFLVALPLFYRRGRNMFSDPAAVMRLSLLGLFLFLMLFETRSRYLFLYLPFFILLMVLTMDSVMSQIRTCDVGATTNRSHQSAGRTVSSRFR